MRPINDELGIGLGLNTNDNGDGRGNLTEAEIFNNSRGPGANNENFNKPLSSSSTDEEVQIIPSQMQPEKFTPTEISPFRFLDVWLSHPEFKPFVESKWKNYSISG